LLYSGKLKSDTGSVVKKDDDLSTKIDTAQRKPVIAEVKKTTLVIADTVSRNSEEEAKEMTAEDKKENAVLWDEFIDSMAETLKEEVMSSKKVKKGDYTILIDYEIGFDGQVTIKNVYPTPESEYLQIHIKERLSIAAPKLNPVISDNGKARKLNKRHTLNLSK
jgi:hypothetical protein